MKKNWTRTTLFLWVGAFLAGCSSPPPDEPSVVLGPDQVFVRTGDTLYGLAEKHNVSLKQLMAVNHLSSSTIRAGQILLIPQSSQSFESRPKDTQDSPDAISRKPLAPLESQNTETSAASAAYIDPSLSHEIALERQRLGSLESVSSEPVSSSVKSGASAIKPSSPESNLSPVPKAEIVQKTPFIWPVKGDIISPFKRSDTDGFIKIAAPLGTPVKASASGVVKVRKDNFGRFGKLLVVQGEDKTFMIYSNLDKISVAEGAPIQQGQILGTVGKSGDKNASGLSFGIRTPISGSDKKKICNPLLLLGGN